MESAVAFCESFLFASDSEKSALYSNKLKLNIW